MPNWCNNTLRIKASTKERLNEILNEIKGVHYGGEDEKCLDFNKIVPMPESLHVVGSSEANNFYDAQFGNYRKILTYPWVVEAGVKTREDLIAFLIKRAGDRAEQALKVAETYKSNIEKYGVKTWYDWSYNHWGTKWNACNSYVDDQIDTVATILFETAWAPPLPVIEALGEKYPDATVRLDYDEPGMCFAGTLKMKNGEVEIQEQWEVEPVFQDEDFD